MIELLSKLFLIDWSDICFHYDLYSYDKYMSSMFFKDLLKAFDAIREATVNPSEKMVFAGLETCLIYAKITDNLMKVQNDKSTF